MSASSACSSSVGGASDSYESLLEAAIRTTARAAATTVVTPIQRGARSRAGAWGAPAIWVNAIAAGSPNHAPKRSECSVSPAITSVRIPAGESIARHWWRKCSATTTANASTARKPPLARSKPGCRHSDEYACIVSLARIER